MLSRSSPAIEVLDLSKPSFYLQQLVTLVDQVQERCILAEGALLIAANEVQGVQGVPGVPGVPGVSGVSGVSGVPATKRTESLEGVQAACFKELALLGDRARVSLSADASLPHTLAALHHLLFNEEGYRGNREAYFELENALLPAVMKRHLGLPITLSILYIEVAARLGVETRGISFPGHFLVRCDLDDGFLVIDPFNGGRLLDAKDCEALLEEITEGQRSFSQEILEPASSRQIFTRLGLNLRRIHLRSGDLGRALRAQNIVVALNRRSIPALRNRAHLYSRLGVHRLAAKDLSACLGLRPNAAGLQRALQEELSRAEELGRHLG